MAKTSVYLTSPQVRERYNITDMTLWRWTHDEGMNFPSPVIIRRRKYYLEDEIIEWERSRAANRKAVAA